MKKRAVVILTVCVVAALFMGACGKKKGAKEEGAKKETPKTVIAKIGDKDVVTWEELENAYHVSRLKQRYNEEQVRRLIDNIVRQHTVYLDSVEKGLDKDPEFVEQIERMKRQLISRIAMKRLSQEKFEVTDQDVKAYYDANPDNFNVMKIQYLMFSQAKFGNDVQKAKAEAQKALSAVKGGMSLEDAAKKFLGRERAFSMTLRKGQDSFFGKAFDDTLWAMSSDGLSGLIETPQGVLFAKVLEKSTQTFEESQSYIRTTLNREKSTKKVDEYYASLMKKYNVKIDEDAIKLKMVDLGKAPESQPGGGPGMQPGGPGLVMPPTPPPGGTNPTPPVPPAPPR